VERVIARLEPLLLERRLARMQAVLATRSDHVAFVFERMTDPHNLSAALRSLDAFSFQDAWWIAAGEKLELSHLISRGTHRWLSLHAPEGTTACLAALRTQGYRVLASHLGEAPGASASVSLPQIDFRRRTALVFGNEHAGVSGEVLALADGRFHIDMLGFTESLNLSVAVAISAFHARREIDRLRGSTGDPDAYLMAPARRRALYAQWLKDSVRRAEEVVGTV
jgi:tRNA (guanosine-2'-O-)-methyltransferase